MNVDGWIEAVKASDTGRKQAAEMFSTWPGAAEALLVVSGDKCPQQGQRSIQLAMDRIYMLIAEDWQRDQEIKEADEDLIRLTESDYEH